MIFWIFVFALCAICLCLDGLLVKKPAFDVGYEWRASREQRRICLIAVAALALIAAMRNIGGTDYQIYRAVYNNAPDLGDYIKNYSSLDDRYRTFGVERGYLFLNSFFKTLRFSYYGYIFIQAMFVVLALYYSLREYTGEFMLVIFVFLYKFYFYNVFISLRQPLTIALFFIMLKFMEKKRFVAYMLMCALAFTFHTAAIVLFPLYFLNRLRMTKRLLVTLNIIFIPTIILAEMDVPVIRIFEPILDLDIFATDEVFMKAEALITGESLNAINWLHTAEYFLIMILLIVFFDQIKQAHPKADTMIKLFVCLLPIFTLFRNYEILTRIKDYFTISYGFIISYIATIQKGRYRFITYCATFLWCGFGFFRFITLFDGGAMMKYKPNFMLGRGLFE